MECFRLLFDHISWTEHKVLSGIRDSRKTRSLWRMRGVGGVRKSIHQMWLAKGLGLLWWGFKGVQEEIPWEEASTLQIGSVAFPPGQCTTPQVHPCHRPRLASRQFLSLSQVQTLLPVTFGYSLSAEAVVMRQLRRWRGCVKVIDTLTKEDFHGAFQNLLKRYKCIAAGGDNFEGY